MTRLQAEQHALSVMTAGYNCAETILQTAIDQCGIAAAGLSPRIATCFGGGIGRSHAGMCGALSGSIMALGLAYGRDAVGQPCDAGLGLAAEFQTRFTRRFGASCCRDLLEHFGPQQNWSACKQLVSETAGMLHDLLQEHRTRH